MNLFTDTEYTIQSQHFAYRLVRLYKTNRDAFYQLLDYLPFPVYINERVSLEYEYFSSNFFDKGKEIEILYDSGIDYLRSISNFYLQEIAEKKASDFHNRNDYQEVCSYLQSILLNNEHTPFVTNKHLINKKLTLNTTLFPSDFGFIHKTFKILVPEGQGLYFDWQRFQTLTKQEKLILKLFAEGLSNKQLSDRLFISVHTVKTHRKNIYKKLDIKSMAQAVRLAMVLDLVEH